MSNQSAIAALRASLAQTIVGQNRLLDRLVVTLLDFAQGPLFHEIVLADEINRLPVKVQSALLVEKTDQSKFKYLVNFDLLANAI